MGEEGRGQVRSGQAVDVANMVSEVQRIERICPKACAQWQRAISDLKSLCGTRQFQSECSVK